MKPRWFLVFALCALAGCSALTPGGGLSVGDAKDVPRAIAQAREDLAAGRTEDALTRMLSARELRQLGVEQRDDVERLVELSAARRIEELSSAESDPDDLADMIELDLPQQLSVAAGLAAARRYVAVDEPYDAFRTLRDLETKYPLHHGRSEAGAILVDIGLSLARSDAGFWFWTDRDDAFPVLEFLVLTYPSERRCDEAFFELARLYEEDGDYKLAIQRHEELLLAHFSSPLSVRSQARIPRLRLLATESPEYDRRELLRARRELEAWRKAHAGHELEADVHLDYADVLQRLTQSDLIIAAFYRRISRPYGARFHASRALETARTANAPALIARAESFLAGLPRVSELPGAPSDERFGHDSTEIQEALDRQNTETKEPEPRNTEERKEEP